MKKDLLDSTYKFEIYDDPQLKVIQKYNELQSNLKRGDFEDILRSIVEVQVSDDVIKIKLNKSLIIETENTITISKGYDITLANNIQLNPNLKIKDERNKIQ